MFWGSRGVWLTVKGSDPLLSRNAFLTFKKCRNFLKQPRSRECLLLVDVVVFALSRCGLQLAPECNIAGLECEAVKMSFLLLFG